MEQQVIITDSQHDVQIFLDEGWRVVSVTAQHVSISGSSYLSVNNGKFCFVLERSV
jgi:hypothetical protein